MEEERLEKQGVPKEETKTKKMVTNRLITMKLVGANPAVDITSEDNTSGYDTYGKLLKIIWQKYLSMMTAPW